MILQMGVDPVERAGTLGRATQPANARALNVTEEVAYESRVEPSAGGSSPSKSARERVDVKPQTLYPLDGLRRITPEAPAGMRSWLGAAGLAGTRANGA